MLEVVSNKVCIPNKTEDLNLRLFNMITGINESKTLAKHASCKCKCKLDGKKCSSNQWWTNDNVYASVKKKFSFELHSFELHFEFYFELCRAHPDRAI